MTMSASDVVLSTGGKDLTPACGRRVSGDRRVQHLDPAQKGTVGRSPTTPDSSTRRPARAPSPSSTGTRGILRYRGYPIEQLAGQSTFLETTYLLIYGALPTASELAAFRDEHPAPHDAPRGPQGVLPGLPRDAHPMPVLSSAVSALSTFYQDSLDPSTRSRWRSRRSGCWPLPTIAAYAHKKSVGQPFLYPDNSLGLTENFLRMTFGFRPSLRGRPRGRQSARHASAPPRRPRAELLDLDRPARRQLARQSLRVGLGRHQRALRSAPRRSEPVRAGDAGPAACLGEKPADFMLRVKNKEPGSQLMGFGHRVYKNYDPRATLVKKAADDVLRSSASPTRCSRSPGSSRPSRSVTTTSSSGGSTPMSTSTPA